MNFEKVKVIEDTHGLLGKSIFISERYLFNDPMSIKDVEIFEESLKRNRIPYVLAQLETTVYHQKGDLAYDLRSKSEKLPDSYPSYAKGYCLFVEPQEDEETLPEDPGEFLYSSFGDDLLDDEVDMEERI